MAVPAGNARPPSFGSRPRPRAPSARPASRLRHGRRRARAPGQEPGDLRRAPGRGSPAAATGSERTRLAGERAASRRTPRRTREAGSTPSRRRSRRAAASSAGAPAPSRRPRPSRPAGRAGSARAGPPAGRAAPRSTRRGTLRAPASSSPAATRTSIPWPTRSSASRARRAAVGARHEHVLPHRPALALGAPRSAGTRGSRGAASRARRAAVSTVARPARKWLWMPSRKVSSVSSSRRKTRPRAEACSNVMPIAPCVRGQVSP